MVEAAVDLLILAGAVIMAWSILAFVRLRRMLAAVPAEVFAGHPPRSEVVLTLMAFFLGGYGVVLGSNLLGYDLAGAVLVGLIFFFGAIFVLLTVRFQTSSIRLLQVAVENLSAERQLLAESNTALEALSERRRQVVQELQTSEVRFRQLAAASFEGLVICTSEEILDVNDSLCRIYRVDLFGLMGMRPVELVHVGSRSYFYSRILQDDEQPFECLGLRADGTSMTLEIRRRTMEFSGREAMVLAMRDVSERKTMEERLRHEVMHDPLTGLPNRTLCLDRIRQSMARGQRKEGFAYGVVVVGLDRFKIVNDSLGHALGDKLLGEVARRVRDQVRDFDTVARFGGDEFILLLEDCPSKLVLRIVKRLRAALREPVRIGSHVLQVSASYGIVLGPVAETTPEQILQNAKLALQRAKAAGRDRYKVFLPSMLDRALDIMHLENDIRRGLEHREFVLFYQPVIDIGSRDCLCAFEALVRWNHPLKGCVGPAEFIQLAEETGLIGELGRYVMQEACRQLVIWRTELPAACAELRMSVNLSAMQIGQPGIVAIVRQALESTGAPPDHVVLEITESAVMSNPQTAMSKIGQLKKLGVRISIDDFGTGYSSLAYLERFPADGLKIDRSFINRIEQTSKNAAIVSAVIQLAHSLGLKVVAEGVEERAQLELLRSLGCDAIQGYFYSPPVPADAARDMLVTQTLLERGR